jgi:hypothetical protein
MAFCLMPKLPGVMAGTILFLTILNFNEYIPAKLRHLTGKGGDYVSAVDRIMP